MKESARKAKKDAKRNERLQRKSDARATNADGEPLEEGADEADSESEQEPDAQ